MKFWSKSIMIFSIIIAVTACSNGKNTDSENNHSETNNSQNEGAEEEFLTGVHFPDTNDFLVHKFDITYDSATNTINYDVVYSFGELPKKYLLQGEHSYYLYLDIPQDYAKFFTAELTTPVKGESLINGDDSYRTARYQTNIKAPLKGQLTNDIINSIVQHPQGYSITVFEKPDYPAKRIVGVYEFVDFLPPNLK
ncbi:hypothetical protein OIN60_20475 [Paenibacillus sp. P96]|uniref:Lipoprotein n=1 Tax=Paenibacillus zeirhizosphaerae TaxID=2987519 RepID=A0ABT9FWK3_9BACL|nr:hypothetical protein [Paenibacillus sp. P96]MDP4099104.1 hypothetical protein [Paenibacillus sp. P96]